MLIVNRVAIKPILAIVVTRKIILIPAIKMLTYISTTVTIPISITAIPPFAAMHTMLTQDLLTGMEGTGITVTIPMYIILIARFTGDRFGTHGDFLSLLWLLPQLLLV